MSTPNILVILTDQQRFDTIHALGNPVIRTPNLDRLVREGTSFTSAYTPSPVCVPARNSLLTGRYPHNTGCFDLSDIMPESAQWLPQLLGDAGYRTHAIGKMHFTPDALALRGFQSRERQEVGALRRVEDDDYVSYLHANGFDHIHDPYGPLGEMFYVPQPAQMPARLHGSQWVADRTLAFLDQMDGDQPFFLFSSFFHPHPPFSPPTPWNKLYRPQLLPYPKRPHGYEHLQTFASRNFTRKYYMGNDPNDDLMRIMKAYYYGCISFVDFQIGRILEALEAANILDSTMIIFTSDHGEMLGDYGCLTKCSMLDPAERIPLIVRFPERFAADYRSNIPANLVDILPTALTAGGVECGDLHLDGEDLRSVSLKEDRTVYSQYREQAHGQYMALSRRWKYFYSAPDRREFLFDRVQDPEETINLARTSLRSSVVNQMRSDLLQYYRKDGYTDPIDGDGWRLFPQPELPADPFSDLAIHDVEWSIPHQTIPGYSDKQH
jgi:arylsulfatase A-like enzyme